MRWRTARRLGKLRAGKEQQRFLRIQADGGTPEQRRTLYKPGPEACPPFQRPSYVSPFGKRFFPAQAGAYDLGPPFIKL